MIRKGVLCILLLAFLSFAFKPHNAFAMGSSTMSYETVGVITVVTIVVLFGIPYLVKKHKEKPQKEEEALGKKEEARQRQKAFIHDGEMALIRW